MLQERRGQTPQYGQGGLQPRVGDGADLDVHQGPGAARLVTQPGALPALAPAGVQGDAPTRAWRGGEGGIEIGGQLQTLTRQGGADQRFLPGQVRRALPVLNGAAAARLEMGADGRGPLQTRRQHLPQFAPLAFRLEPHALTRQDEGREQGLARGRAAHAVALRSHGQHLGLNVAGVVGQGVGPHLIHMNEDERVAQRSFRLQGAVSHHRSGCGAT